MDDYTFTPAKLSSFKGNFQGNYSPIMQIPLSCWWHCASTDTCKPRRLKGRAVSETRIFSSSPTPCFPWPKTKLKK